MSLRERHYRAKYRLTGEQVAALIASQGGRCAICSGTESRGKCELLSVDHCYETGAIRGMLCQPCNIGIGRFGDNAEGLRLVLDYVSGGLWVGR